MGWCEGTVPGYIGQLKVEFQAVWCMCWAVKRQTDRRTHRHTDRRTHKHTDTDTDTQTHRHTDTDTETQT